MITMAKVIPLAMFVLCAGNGSAGDILSTWYN